MDETMELCQSVQVPIKSNIRACRSSKGGGALAIVIGDGELLTLRKGAKFHR